ncbi:MAG TPA: fibronectin/fibrinogen-binding protein [Clostridia bacterium]|nr:fibronectin/fibrinogen-binding protein [Clostridia bacterium]
MPFDGITLNAVKQELEQFLIEKRIDRIYQPGKETIIIKFRMRSDKCNLLVSCSADSARIHLLDSRQKSPPQPPIFCMVLRKYLEGGQLICMEQKGLERVLTLHFRKVNEAGSVKNLALHCEIMGRHSNIVLVDSDTNCILDGAKRLTLEVNRYRQILPGMPYVPPPSQNKHDFRTITEEDFFNLLLAQPLNSKLHQILLNIYEGFSPLICREIVVQAGLTEDIILDECGEYELGRVWQVLIKMAEDMAASRFNPVLVRDNSKYIQYAPFDLLQYPENKKEYFESVNEALNTFFTAKEYALRFNEKKHKLERLVNAQIKKGRNKLAVHEQDLIETEDTEKDRIAGELITANMYNVSRGDREINTPNYYDPEQKNVVIPLDPSLTPSQNAQKYFKKYRKGNVKKQKAVYYIDRTREELLYLDTVSMAISQAATLEELEEIREELANQGYLKKEKRKTPVSTTPGYLTYISTDGFTIMVGKNNRQNDYLTMKVAQDEDMWLHTKDIPGAHVIVKSEGRRVPERTLLEAAMLAAYYSRGKLSGNIPVDYTLKKHVRKPIGAKPGMVIYDHHSTVYVKPESNPRLSP